MQDRMTRLAAAALAALALAPAAARAAVIAPGYAVAEIALPDFAAGDVVVVGDALFVGVGPAFVGGQQSVLRLDAGGTTVVATGFQGLGGMAYDAANDRLLVADNAREAPFAVTGDTLFAIPAPLTRTSAQPALGSELLAAGALPGVADLELDPQDPSGGTLFATDAVTNQVLRISLAAGTATPIVQLTAGFAAGLAVDADTLWFGDVAFDASWNAIGSVAAVALPGGTAAPLATGLPGEYDLERASDGSLLASAGGALVRIDPLTGQTTTLATGFGFATGLFERDGAIWVLDGGFPGVASVFRLTPIPEPGAASLLSIGLALLARRGRRAAR